MTKISTNIDNPTKQSVRNIIKNNNWNSIPITLTYDDVLLVPNYSTVNSRSNIDISTNITSKIKLNSPIISSNMDTVTEAPMAIAMARDGGLGVIHRFMSIEEQVKQVNKVKRSESIIIEEPYTLTEDSPLKHAWSLMNEKSVSSILVTDSEYKLKGILTKRDFIFEENPNISISSLMTKDVISAHFGISLENAKELLRKNRIEKLPIIDEKNRIKGLITSKDLTKSKTWPQATKDHKGRLLVAAAIGVKNNFLQRAEELISANCDIIVVDIAHGHSLIAIETVKKLRRNFGSDISIIAGNVATGEGTAALISAGSDGVKVGVGPGSICITRKVAGAGIPQLSALMEASQISHDEKIPLIADGGIKNSGDIAKAIGAGASSVMLGSLLAGTSESPGLPVLRNGRQVKIIRGMASLGASLGRDMRTKGSFDDDLMSVSPEGVEAIVPYRGSVNAVIKKLIAGLRSGMSYTGAKNISEMWKLARFVRITNAGILESGSHDVDEV